MLSTKFTQNRNVQFYVLNIIGWSGYCLATYISVVNKGKPLDFYETTALAALLGAVVTIPLRLVYRRIWNFHAAPKVVIVLLASFAVTLIWTGAVNYLRAVISTAGPSPNAWSDYVWGASIYYYLFISWSCLYFVIKFYQGMVEAGRRELQATSLAHEAQLKMLRYQLNPHFLFNTLNTISTLVLDGQHESANRMIIGLSDFLRYSLDNDPLQKVTLEQEITALELYLAIEKVRFGEQLELDLGVDERAGKALVPSLILQPLVENAIKYAIARSETGGLIGLRTKLFANELLLELWDTGPGIDLVGGQLPTGRGVGIRNTRERLEQLYGENQSFSVTNREPHGLQISIRLPYEAART